MGWWIAIAFVAGLVSLVLQSRVIDRLRAELAAERAAHADAGHLVAAMRDELTRTRGELDEVRALRAGGPFRSS